MVGAKIPRFCCRCLAIIRGILFSTGRECLRRIVISFHGDALDPTHLVNNVIHPKVDGILARLAALKHV
jgi:hypothetical protein